MINFKKKNKKLKTETFVNQFPILVLLQHNNLTINEWFDFKSQIQLNYFEAINQIRNKIILLSIPIIKSASNFIQIFVFYSNFLKAKEIII